MQYLSPLDGSTPGSDPYLKNRLKLLSTSSDGCNFRYSENESGSIGISTYLPEMCVDRSDDNILELDPVMYRSHMCIVPIAATLNSHLSTFWISSKKR